MVSHKRRVEMIVERFESTKARYLSHVQFILFADEEGNVEDVLDLTGLSYGQTRYLQALLYVEKDVRRLQRCIHKGFLTIGEQRTAETIESILDGKWPRAWRNPPKPIKLP